MIDLHHTTLISSRRQVAIPIPAGFPALADQIQIPTTALDSEQASQQEQQQALLREMRTEDRREEEDGLAATVGSEAIPGEPRIIVTRKVLLTVDDRRLLQDVVHLPLRQKLPLDSEELSADDNYLLHEHLICTSSLFISIN